ncbi:Glyoxalase/Bleomycin resistance protein/Dioxygenase superfamily protein [Tistlia consotensis]|uniref:Glyoxalase/Bleomycin resistance protein/Dioxygenase superfamily protein n=1 Tax=Tistlia consotensis USBA 355 TaxID=560819 RepID=A0A1Y6CWC4_9PROT|nr:VOC family protein [Tistlia consotensis]SMF82362.1 Glyoxalase/Bleomycin resistance protein/Dioxygenase superfamily protein [Tistlia consotensis USBA 355]SNS27528.1 Glyoxalase/Bleomycin resistance protein/Dioxygenase superfamily protein [Tistlia consotensis]
MALKQLNHVNLRTADLDRLVDFYGEVLDLRPGWRPPFDFPGAWLYCGEQPVVHLVGESRPRAGHDPKLEHFAFAAEDLGGFLAHLRARKVAYWVRIVPGIELRQVNFLDPDGNHIHVDFDRSEDADLGDYDGR